MKKISIVLLAFLFIGITSVNAQTTTEEKVENKTEKVCSKTGKVCDDTCEKKKEGTCCNGDKKKSCSKSEKTSCSKKESKCSNSTEKSSCCKK